MKFSCGLFLMGGGGEGWTLYCYGPTLPTICDNFGWARGAGGSWSRMGGGGGGWVWLSALILLTKTRD